MKILKMGRQMSPFRKRQTTLQAGKRFHIGAREESSSGGDKDGKMDI